MTRTSTGALVDSSFNPSCCWKGGEQIRSGIGIVARGRWRAADKRRLSRIGCELQREIVPFGKA